jgi:uncharacterized membrane protein
VLGEIPAGEPDNIILRGDPTTNFRSAPVVVGLVIFALGALLAAGNRTGLATTVPYGGFAVMAIGGGIMSAGRS